jgi:hypothetical protein
MTTFAPIRVDGPVPAPPRHTILTVSDIVPDGGERWEQGVSVYPYPCGPDRRFDQCGTIGTPKVLSTTQGPIDFGSFAVYLNVQCTMRGIGNDVDDYRQRALAAFMAFEHEQVEGEWWDGTQLPNNVHLTSATSATSPLTVLNGGAATNLMNGLAILEGSIKRSAVIHMSTRMATGLFSQRLLVENTIKKRIETRLGTPVIPGTGYSGNAPTGSAANGGTEEFVFATTPLQIRRSEPFLTPETPAQALDRTLNNLTYYAERYYVVDFDACLRVGVRIDRNKTTP